MVKDARFSQRIGVALSALFAVVGYAGCSAPAESPSEEPRVASVSEADLAFNFCTRPVGITSSWLATGTDCSCTGLTGPAATECLYEQKILSCLHQRPEFPAGCTALPPLPVVALWQTNVPGKPDSITSYDLAADVMHLIPGIKCEEAQVVKACITAVNNTTVFRGFPNIQVVHPYQLSPVEAHYTHWCADTGLQTVCDTELNMVDVFDPCSSSSCFKQ